VPELAFPSFPVPHMEFYRPRDVSNSTGYLAFAGLSAIDIANGCAAATDTRMAAIAAGSPTVTATQKIRCSFTGSVDVRVAPLNRTTTRIVRKTIFVRVKGKRVKRIVKRPVKTVTRIGTLATAAATGSADTLVSVEIKQGSTARYDTRFCTPVPLTS
jgi:hypothetical protein